MAKRQKLDVGRSTGGKKFENFLSAKFFRTELQNQLFLNAHCENNISGKKYFIM